MNRKVKYAKLHQAVHCPDAGQLSDVLEAGTTDKYGRAGTKSVDGLQMVLTENFLTVKFKVSNPRYNGPVEVAIPTANIAILQLFEE